MFKTRSSWKVSNDGKILSQRVEKKSPFIADMKYLQKKGLKIAIHLGRL